jgi:uncharacterized protein
MPPGRPRAGRHRQVGKGWVAEGLYDQEAAGPGCGGKRGRCRGAARGSLGLLRFWDSSALMPLLAKEGRSAEITELLEDDRELVVWWASRTECISAVRRLERDGAPVQAVRRSLERLTVLAAHWAEIAPVETVRETAERLLAIHPLRAADAMQLAAALAWRRGRPGGARFVCLDGKLREAAEREGFSLLPLD